MTFVAKDGSVVIATEPAQQCDFCGQIRELRPYGPQGETICFPWAMLNEREALRQFARRVGRDLTEAELDALLADKRRSA